jgi:hypothetical protein
VDYLLERALHPHSSNEYEFVGDVQQGCLQAFLSGELNILDGALIGIKTGKTRKPILLEDLLEEKELDLAVDHCGIYLPADDILKRTKYQWFAFLSRDEILRSRLAIAKHMRLAVLDKPSSSEQKVFSDV